MQSANNLSRRDWIKRTVGASLLAPMTYRNAAAAPSEIVQHASMGASSMALADIRSLTESKHLKLVAVAEVDRNKLGDLKKLFPEVRVYSDWRKLLDQEKQLDSINVSTPDHMHAPIAISAMQRGLHVYGQKPLAQTLHECRRMAEVAAEKNRITQMGIQVHSHAVHRIVNEIIRAKAIGKVKQVHSWSGKQWGDKANRPNRTDPVPDGFDWDLWLGVASPRPFIGNGYYHPGNWRKRLDFGTGTFGDMGCHILDPVFNSCGLTSPLSVTANGDGPSDDSWGLNCHVVYRFPATEVAADGFELHWYHGGAPVPADVRNLVGKGPLHDQGSVYIGEAGVLYAPYIAPPLLLPKEKFADYRMPQLETQNHYLQFVEAVRGNGKASAPFSYAGPLTEMVLLGCLATRFPGAVLQFDSKTLKVRGHDDAQMFVRRQYREGWAVDGV